MAASQTTEQFRAVLLDTDKFSELIDQLGATDLIPLLVRYKGLEKIEGDELKGKLRGLLGRERNPIVIKRIMEKNTLSAYRALSQVIQFKNEHIWTKLFPFAKGTHPTLSYKPQSPQLIQPAAEQPAIIWLCANEDIFKLAASKFVKSSTPLKATQLEAIKYYEIPPLTDYDDKVWLCKITSSNLKPDTMYKFYRTYCNSKYCLFIGTCATIDDPKFQLDDICIASQSKHCMSGFVSTLEHVTREWESSNEIGRWFCDQRRENSSPSVVFGKVGKDDLDNTVDFISNDALQFCRSSENAYSKGARIQHTAILLATEDSTNKSEEWCDCGQKNIVHVVNYSNKLIEHLVTKITIQKSRCGRNPSV